MWSAPAPRNELSGSSSRLNGFVARREIGRSVDAVSPRTCAVSRRGIHTSCNSINASRFLFAWGRAVISRNTSNQQFIFFHQPTREVNMAPGGALPTDFPQEYYWAQ